MSPLAEITPTVSSWHPVNLTDAIEDRDIPPPELLKRADGVPLLYPERIHWIQGESEALKSWLAQIAVAQTLESEWNSVVYIDFEDNDRGVVARLLSLGVPPATLLDQRRFVYIRPDEPLYDRHGTAQPGLVDFAIATDEFPFINLAVIDGVTNAMATEGLNYLDNTEISVWLKRLPAYLADSGAAVACIDHLTKSREAQGRYAIGGQHKLAGVTGATYKVTATKRLSRALVEPVTGTSLITVEKDRPGWVRARADGDDSRIGVLEITAYPDGGVSAKLLPPDEASTTPPWPLCERILRFLKSYEGASKNMLEKEVDGKAETIRAATTWMVGEGWVEVQPVGNADRHHLTALGKDALDRSGDG